jgi:UDP-2,3-diacylglucosamine hydrolase
LSKEDVGVKAFWPRRIDARHEFAFTRQRIGLLAGWGDYAMVVARALKRQSYEVFGLGLPGHTSEALTEVCDDFRWFGLCKVGAGIRYLRRNGVRTATMAGKYPKIRLLNPRELWNNLPDWRAIRRFGPLFLARRGNLKDDTLLTELLAEFALDGIEFRPPTDFVPEVLVRYGQLTRRGPSDRQRKDVEFGWQIAKEMGRLDIGQTVVVRNRAVVAVEAIEGTDECIRRAGQLCPGGGFTVVKVAKPQQDMRFDVPTVGRHTLENIIRAGGSMLAVEEGKTIIVNEPDVLELANRHRLVVVSLRKDGRCEVPEPETTAA